MIDEMHFERLRLLGHPDLAPRQTDMATSPQVTLPDPRFAEPSGKERLKSPKAFSGNHCALEVLPPLGLTFDSIRMSSLRTRLPALDVGASVSTVAAEGALRGIAIHSTELPPISNRDRFIEAIHTRLTRFGDAYEDAANLPSGFECESIPREQWTFYVNEAVSKVNKTLSECSAAKILGPSGERAPDQSYSIVFSHHGVPKYCSTETFLRYELPELLRVAADRVHLFPFRSAGPGDEFLHVQDSESYRRIEGIAKKAGFSFQTHLAQHLMVDPKMPPPEAGFDTTAVFTRIR
ncbi:MAG: hypothetical protein RL326_616 [Pseudomonadota bacterium]|jgi:hypothetical protein